MDFKVEVSKALHEAVDALSLEEIALSIENPPSLDMGNFAFPCFKLAKTFRKAPNIVAAEIAEKIKNDAALFSRIEAKGAYINFFVDNTLFVREILSEVVRDKERYGSSELGLGKTIVIDYSSPNIAKPFHVAHIPSTVIGRALYNIFNFLGYNAVGINHLGDWGTQFGKLIVGYVKWGSKEAVEEKGTAELIKLYVKFHDEAEKTPALNDEARNWLLKMEQGDEEALGLWKWFYDISIKEFNKTYERLDVKFDYFIGESFYNDKMRAVAEELKDKELLIKSEGAMIVDLTAYNMAPCLILRSDGATLYPTRDIAAALYRKKTFDFYKCIYLTDMSQNLHFAQWIKVVELMGYEFAKDLVHIPFGLINFEGGKLSTRKGNVIWLEDLLNDAVDKTKKIIEEKNPLLEDKDEVSEQVGIGAVVFNNLFNSKIKDVEFSWDRVLNFDGETGPYVQYTHARACSILRKGGEIDFSNVDYNVLSDKYSVMVAKLLLEFKDKLLEASDKYEPYLITRNLVEICQAFNKFYDNNIVLDSSEDIKNARLCLVYCVKTVIKTALTILGIKAPEKM